MEGGHVFGSGCKKTLKGVVMVMVGAGALMGTMSSTRLGFVKVSSPE